MDTPIGIAINEYQARIGAATSQPGKKLRNRDKGKANPDVERFKKQLESCLQLLMVQSNKDLVLARPCFHTIVRRLDNELVRLENWASDIGVDDPDFGMSSSDAANQDLILTKHMVSLLEDLASQAGKVGTKIEIMRSIITRLSGRIIKDV